MDIPAAEGGGLFENAQSCDRNGGESREDEPEVEDRLGSQLGRAKGQHV